MYVNLIHAYVVDVVENVEKKKTKFCRNLKKKAIIISRWHG